ncbi:MAG: hypothetical protein R3C28_18485 [Pirellulaceae bacterium]
MRIKSADVLGQIIPCPKCMSMVMVPESAHGLEPAPAESMVVSPEQIQRSRDSFEQLDDLLENPDQTHANLVAAIANGQRWKTKDAPVRHPESPEEAAAESESADEEMVLQRSVLLGLVGLQAKSSLLWKMLLGAMCLTLGGLFAVGAGLWVAKGRQSDSNEVVVQKPVVPSPLTEDDAFEQDAANDPIAESQDDTDNVADAESNSIESSDANAPVPPDVVANDDPESNDDGAPEDDNLPANPLDDLEGNDLFAETPETKTDSEDQVATPEDLSSPLQLGSRDNLSDFAEWLQTSAGNAPSEFSVVAGPDPEEAELDEGEPTVVMSTRPVPKAVEVDQLLNLSIAGIDIKSVPLNEALRMLTDFSTLPITILPDSLERTNVAANRPANVMGKDVTVRQVLERMLGSMKLATKQYPGHIVISTANDAAGRLLSKKFPIQDVATNPEDAQRIASWVQNMIELESYMDRSTIEASDGDSDGERTTSCVLDGDGLVVTATDLGQFRVLVFLERLRKARNEPALVSLPARLLATTPRWQMCSYLEREGRIRVWKEVPIGQVLAEFEQQSGLNILVDWYALHFAGTAPTDVASFFGEKTTIAEQLHAFLQPLGLTYRVIDDTTIEITSVMQERTSIDVEFYSLTEDETADAFQAALQKKVGARPFGPDGVCHAEFDPVSKQMIVAMPQSFHRKFAQSRSALP